MAAEPEFPGTIHVAPYDYTLVLDTDGRLDEVENLDGLCDLSRKRIFIRPDLATSSEQDTVLHETLHAVFDQLDVKRRLKDVDGEFEEDVVYALAPRLLALLRDNPELVEYLTS